MQPYEDIVQKINGDVIPNAPVTVTVGTSGGALASLFDAVTGVAITNPLTTDAQGNFLFKAANGTYVVSSQGGSKTIFLLDPADGLNSTPIGQTTKAAGGFTDLTTTGNTILGDATTDTLNVGNGGIIKDASGNVGIGVTPKPWGAGNNSLTVGIYGSISYNSGAINFVSNGYQNSGSAWTYAFSDTASQYQQVSGTHIWRTAVAGTAGNPITFTEAMRIDASGNVGIGIAPAGSFSTGKALQIRNYSVLNETVSGRTQLSFNLYESASNVNSYIVAESGSIYRQVSGVHSWHCAPAGTGGTVATTTQVLSLEKDKSVSLQGATTQTGCGISFPATQVPSTDPNTLDDYEEGTWTPVQGSGLTLVGAFGFANAVYTKKGREVTVTCTLTGATSIAVGGTGIACTGLPFTVAGSFVGGATNGSVSVAGTCLAQTTTLYCTPFAASVAVYLTVTYFV
jgi:hypothetical protein